MKKTKKVVRVFCLLFFLTTLISFSQQNKILKDPIPVPPEQGMIICDDPIIDQYLPVSPVWNSRHSEKYKGMVAGDYDGDGFHEVAFDFGSQGIWIYDPNAATAWNKISDNDPVWMIAITISSISDDELFAEWDSNNTPKNSWWDYNSGYPGTWCGVSNDPPADYAYDAGDVNGDGDHEVVVQWDGRGIYVCNYVGSGIYGGFDIYRISPTESRGFPMKMGVSDYELLHVFSDGTKYWDYTSGYPSTNWFSINPKEIDISDSIAADVDGDASITDELMADILNQLWLYDHDTATWVRYDYNWVCEMYAVAHGGEPDEQYEFYVRFCSVDGLWGFNPPYRYGVRASWNEPEYILGADIRTVGDGGNCGEETIADFGTTGVWIRLTWVAGWTRINWNNSQAMIKADLDNDPEMEIIFDFGSLGVWVWDGATGSGTWTRINWGNPESSAASCDGCDR